MPSTSCPFADAAADELSPCVLPVHHSGPHVLESAGIDQLLARLAQGVIADVLRPAPPQLLRSGVVVHDPEGAVVAVAVSEEWAARLVGEVSS